MKSSKKGFVDVIASIVALFLFIVVIVALGVMYSKTGDALEDSKSQITGVSSYNESADLVINQANKFPAFWDFLILLIAFGLWIGLMISSWLLGNNAIFLVAYVLLMIVLLIFGIVMQVAGTSMMENVTMAEYFVDYPITQFLLNHFLLYVVFLLVTTAFALYMKVGREG